MFELIKGAFIEDISGIQKGYRVDGNIITACVSAGNIPALFEAFLNSMREDPTVIKEYHIQRMFSSHASFPF